MKFVEIDGTQYEVLSFFKNVAKVLTNPFRNFLLPKWVLRVFMKYSGSPLVEESLKRPGGWRAMEIIYENAPPVGFIDAVSLRYGPFPMALRNRRKYVTKKIAGLIKQHAENGPVTILGVGAGPGTYVQEGIVLSGVDKSLVTVYLVDIDDDAFEYGMKKARERGLEDRVNFIKGDAREIRKYLPDIKPQIVKMIGLMEYFTDDQVKELMKVLYEVMAPGGSLITHGLVDYHNFTPFLARMLNWHIIQRTGEQMAAMMEGCGFKNIESFETPMKIYTIVTGEK